MSTRESENGNRNFGLSVTTGISTLNRRAFAEVHRLLLFFGFRLQVLRIFATILYKPSISKLQLGQLNQNRIERTKV